MSPFRVILKKGGVEHPVGYSLLLAVMAVLVTMLAAVTISVKASERAIRASERRQCESIAADLAAYREEPPQTKAGQAQLRSKENLFRIWGCPRSEEEEK